MKRLLRQIKIRCCSSTTSDREEELNEMEPEAAAAVNRLFEICEGETTTTSFSDEELHRLLE